MVNIIVEHMNGTREALAARIEPDVISQGGKWLPGIIILTRSVHPMTADFISCAINEGNETSGYFEPLESDDSILEFNWHMSPVR